MSFYCLCETSNNKPDSQHFLAPNRYAAVSPGIAEVPDFPPLALRRAMVCIKTGAAQVLLFPGDDKANDWTNAERPKPMQRHYPNVDVYECPNCRARIARE